MRFAIFIILVLKIGPTYSQSDDILGIAELALLDIDLNDTIYIYNSPNLDDKYIGIFDPTENQDNVFYYYDFKSDIKRLSSIRKNLEDFNPKFFYYDYSMLFPIIVEECEYFYKIKIDKDKYKYLAKNTSFIRFISYKYLLSNYDVLVNENNKFYETPDTKSNTITADYYLTYKVVVIRGDWIKLRSIEPLYYEGDDFIEIDGWTRWKKGDNILVGFLFHPN